MVTGNLGKPGCGVNPLRGQNNVQGACDMGAGPDDMPGYQKVADPAVRHKFEQAWGMPLPAWRGLKATECFPAMLDGRIKGLFLFGEDPVRTDPDTHHVIRALEALEFFVVDDLFLTETGAPCRRGAAGPQLRGEGRHVHQHRTARAARAQGGGRAGGAVA